MFLETAWDYRQANLFHCLAKHYSRLDLCAELHAARVATGRQASGPVVVSLARKTSLVVYCHDAGRGWREQSRW